MKTAYRVGILRKDGSIISVGVRSLENSLDNLKLYELAESYWMEELFESSGILLLSNSVESFLLDCKGQGCAQAYLFNGLKWDSFSF